mgnify:CR=1 FL=1
MKVFLFEIKNSKVVVSVCIIEEFFQCFFKLYGCNFIHTEAGKNHTLMLLSAALTYLFFGFRCRPAYAKSSARSILFCSYSRQARTRKYLGDLLWKGRAWGTNLYFWCDFILIKLKSDQAFLLIGRVTWNALENQGLIYRTLWYSGNRSCNNQCLKTHRNKSHTYSSYWEQTSVD